jgi:hypothetical protein
MGQQPTSDGNQPWSRGQRQFTLMKLELFPVCIVFDSGCEPSLHAADRAAAGGFREGPFLRTPN